ncbi:MAG TPA: DUF1622 domain-containing protein [Ktedonobacterales bacterium]|jgi:uncharacterized membrane protein
MNFSTLVELLARIFDIVGLAALLIGTVAALVMYLLRVIPHLGAQSVAYRNLRQGLGRAILVGLELFIAADIIRTVTIEPTFQSIGVLGLIVLVRTFLSWSLEVEINGEWPWRRARREATPPLTQDGL